MKSVHGMLSWLGDPQTLDSNCRFFFDVDAWKASWQGDISEKHWNTCCFIIKKNSCWSQMNVFACRQDSQRKEPTWHHIVQWYTPPIRSSQVCPSTTSCDDHCGWEWCWWTTKSWWFEHRTNSHELILADTIRWDQSYHTDGCLDFNLTGKTLCWFPPKRVGILMDTSNSAWIVAKRPKSWWQILPVLSLVSKGGLV